MKLAIAQLTATADKALNLQRALDYIKQAQQQHIQMLVFPEIFMAFLRDSPQLKYQDVAEPLNGNFVTSLRQAAKQANLYVVCGVLEKSPSIANKCYNSIVLIDNQGKLLHSYQKTHLYDAFHIKESTNFIASENPIVTVTTNLASIGLMVCYELRFPEVSRMLALQQAQIIISPTAWVAGKLKVQHLKCLAQARALENTLFVCVANQVGNIYTGGSLVVNPLGEIIAEAGQEEILLVVDIALKQVAEVRAKLPCLSQRRAELYNW